jgi:hypothetical protein
MSEMILLGAGASVDAGIPDAYQMTSDIANLANAQAESVEYDAVRTDARRVINFVLGGLLFDLAQANQNPIGSGVNVEDLFATVQLLANRNSLEVAPFVGAWHSMIEALDQIHPPPPDLEGFVNEVIEASAEQGANSARISMGGYSSSSRITRDPRDIARDLQGVLEANHSKPGDGDSRKTCLGGRFINGFVSISFG